MTDPNPLAAYQAPGLSLRATWSQGNGPKPDEVMVEWKQHPGREELEAMTLLLTRGGADEVTTNVITNGAGDPIYVHTDSMPGLCCAQLDTGAHRHVCWLLEQHDPAEPGGREHRCACGGLFTGEGEIPDVLATRSTRREGSR